MMKRIHILSVLIGVVGIAGLVYFALRPRDLDPVTIYKTTAIDAPKNADPGARPDVASRNDGDWRSDVPRSSRACKARHRCLKSVFRIDLKPRRHRLRMPNTSESSRNGWASISFSIGSSLKPLGLDITDGFYRRKPLKNTSPTAVLMPIMNR